MKILTACEESQRVCIELRKLGHESYSCDLEKCSGGHPEWHICQDVTSLLNGYADFNTLDGKYHTINTNWDMIIAFPPCTNLAVSGARHFKRKQADGTQQKSIDFFMLIANCDCKKIAIENPVGIMSTKWRKPDQIIHPWQFGDPFEKKTCLWLKGLKPLKPTNIVNIPERQIAKSGRAYPAWMSKGGKERQKNRSKTFIGIAKAMAEQWC